MQTLITAWHITTGNLLFSNIYINIIWLNQFHHFFKHLFLWLFKPINVKMKSFWWDGCWHDHAPLLLLLFFCNALVSFSFSSNNSLKSFTKSDWSSFSTSEKYSLQICPNEQYFRHCKQLFCLVPSHWVRQSVWKTWAHGVVETSHLDVNDSIHVEQPMPVIFPLFSEKQEKSICKAERNALQEVDVHTVQRIEFCHAEIAIDASWWLYLEMNYFIWLKQCDGSSLTLLKFQKLIWLWDFQFLP